MSIRLGGYVYNNSRTPKTKYKTLRFGTNERVLHLQL